MDDNFLILVTC